MVYTVFYKEESYQLPESMRCLGEYQDDSMKYRGNLTLSHVKIVEILIRGEECGLPYKLFIGVMPTNRNSKIIIVGEYFLSYPSDYGSFRHIEVPNSEMTNLVCDPDSDEEFLDVNIFDLESNMCAILLKKEVIIIGITPAFQNYLDENGELDEGNYDNSYLFMRSFSFGRDMTESPFDMSSIPCRSLTFDEEMTSRAEKNDDCSRISLDFTHTCRCSNGSCRTRLHWKTENSLWIDISNEEIRIHYTRCSTTYDRRVIDGHFNDRPTIRTEEEDDDFHYEITYDRFPEEDD